MVYYTSGKCYQYAIIFGDGLIYRPDEIFYTGDKALKVGRESIELLGNYHKEHFGFSTILNSVWLPFDD